MTVKLFDAKGTPLSKQMFTWKELVQRPISKLDDDAFTRVRIILMNGIEQQANRFQHACSQMNGELREHLAAVRRVEHHQQTVVNWLLSADTHRSRPRSLRAGGHRGDRRVAQHEPDPYLAQVYRFGLLEDFDHLYRYSALLDRLEGKDANTILQSYTDIMPAGPRGQHRAPEDDAAHPYARQAALSPNCTP